MKTEQIMALLADLRSRINPAYATQLGTESYERRLCAEAIEQLVHERDALTIQAVSHLRLAAKLAAENKTLREALGHIATCQSVVEGDVVSIARAAIKWSDYEPN